MYLKFLTTFVLIAIVLGLTYFFLDARDEEPLNNYAEREDSEATSVSDTLVANSGTIAGLSEIESMTAEQRRHFYKSISDNEPYVPLVDVLEVLDRGLADTDTKVRLFALNRFVKSHYVYGATEPSTSFNDDLDRRDLLLSMLGDPVPHVREGSFRVLSENYSQQEDVVMALANTVRNENDKRLNMLRSFASVMRSFPEIASRVYIDEVKLGASSPARATPVDSASILIASGTTPKEILEPVIVMLEKDYFGSPALLTVIEKFGPAAKPYLGRLKALQINVNDRIHNSRDDRGKGSSTFSKDRYADVVRSIESSN